MTTSNKLSQGAFIVNPYNSVVDNNSIRFTSPFQLKYNRIILDSCAFTQTFFNVSQSLDNNKITFYSGLTQYTIIIPDAFYNIVDLLAKIELLMEQVTGINNFLVGSLVNGFCQFVIHASNTFRFVRNTQIFQNKIFLMLGLRLTQPVFNGTNISGTFTGLDLANVQILQMLQLSIPQIQQNYPANDNNASFFIPIDRDYGFTQIYQKMSVYDNEIVLLNDQNKTIYDMQIFLQNQDGRLLSFPNNFSYALKFYLVE